VTASPAIAKVSTKAAEVDAAQGLSVKANAALTIGNHYWQSALQSPLGSKVHAFYTSTSKRGKHSVISKMLCSNLMPCFGSHVVLDVHEEALRIKQLKAAEAAAASSSTPAAEASSSTSAAAEVAEEIPGYSVGAGSTAVPEKSIK
jgi:hypothetical protein